MIQWSETVSTKMQVIGATGVKYGAKKPNGSSDSPAPNARNRAQAAGANCAVLPAGL